MYILKLRSWILKTLKKKKKKKNADIVSTWCGKEKSKKNREVVFILPSDKFILTVEPWVWLLDPSAAIPKVDFHQQNQNTGPEEFLDLKINNVLLKYHMVIVHLKNSKQNEALKKYFSLHSCLLIFRWIC